MHKFPVDNPVATLMGDGDHDRHVAVTEDGPNCGLSLETALG